METLLATIFSEHGFVAGLFILMLWGLYKIGRWFGQSYLKLQAEHNQAFLKSFDDMIEKISTGDKAHTQEHDLLMKTISDRHDKNNQQHQLMIGMIKENTENIKLTHSSIEALNKEIKAHCENTVKSIKG